MKVIVTGATGMVGEGVLLECLASSAVDAVLCVGRRPCGHTHPKLTECLVPDFRDLAAVEPRLAGYDACFYCAGVSSVGMSEADYTVATYDTTLAFATALAGHRRHGEGMTGRGPSAGSPDGSLEEEAARHLAEALELVVHLRGREPRERHRRLLEQAIDDAERALAAAEGETSWRARSILARAHAARAEDALHGAGQLSLSAQRAPTLDACDEGWQRVETIVAAAEEASHAAARAADAMVGGPSSIATATRAAAVRAEAAGRAARKIVDERNHAYTFHTDRGFSFGEGWYVAAAAVLAGVAIQIEPGSGTAQAERFLRDAGLGDRLGPYRSRPRANKQTTDLVARAFRADPPDAQRRLRAAFLGDAPVGPVATAVSDWIDARLAAWRDRRKVLVWIRDGIHHPGRNTVHSELVELTRRVLEAGLSPLLLGDALRHGTVPAGAVDLTLFWKEPVFAGDDGRRAQLQFFEHLRHAHGVVGQLGVTTAGMDGPALLGMPTMYLTDAPNVRMRAWEGVVPGYREIVRDSGYLERVSAALNEWGATGLAGRPVTPWSASTSSGALR